MGKRSRRKQTNIGLKMLLNGLAISPSRATEIKQAVVDGVVRSLNSKRGEKKRLN